MEKQKEYWLIGSTSPSLGNSVVPTNRKIMQVACFHNSMGKTWAAAALSISDELATNWQRMNMKGLSKSNIKSKILRLVNSYKLVRKNGWNTKQWSQDKIKAFLNDLDRDFDASGKQLPDTDAAAANKENNKPSEPSMGNNKYFPFILTYEFCNYLR
jgi:hypothetical protein